MPNVVYTPPKNNRQAGIFSVIAMAAAFFLYACSGLITDMRYIPQLCALAIAAVGIQMMTRWCLTSYRYELHDDNLVVVKCVGKREMMVCNLTLRTGVGIFPQKDEAALSSVCDRFDRSYNYVVSFQPESVFVYVFRDADMTCRILLEPDERFLSELRARIALTAEPGEKDPDR